MNGKIWTKDEVALLTSMVSQGYSYIDIAHKLGRTIHSVRLKARSLNIRRIPYKKWSEEETQLLKLLLKTKSLSELSQIFKRSKGAIASKIYQLGLATYHYNELRNSTNINTNLPEWFKGYIAGLVDGEGTVSIEKVNRKDRKYGQYKPIVKISNTCREALDTIAKYVGGFRYTIKEGRTTHNSKKPIYDIQLVRCKDVEVFLEMILPYLIIKRKHAELVLQFCKSRLAKPNHAPYDNEELAIIDEVKKLNNRAYPYTFIVQIMEVI
jgi:hypothetical protein